VPEPAKEKVALPPMPVRSQLTAVPVDAGLAPRVTVALKVVELPATTGFGLAEPVAVGDVDVTTCRLMLKVPERLWASLTVQGSEYVAAPVPPGTA